MARWPTVLGLSLKTVTLTVATTDPLIVAPAFGVTNETFAPGAPTGLVAAGVVFAAVEVVAAGVVVAVLFFLLLPQPATPSAAIAIRGSRILRRMQGSS